MDPRNMRCITAVGRSVRPDGVAGINPIVAKPAKSAEPRSDERRDISPLRHALWHRRNEARRILGRAVTRS